MSERLDSLREILGKSRPQTPVAPKRDLSQLRQILGKSEINKPSEYTYAERALQVPRGTAKGIGGLTNILSEYVAAPITKMATPIAQQLAKKPMSKYDRSPEEVRKLGEETYQQLSTPQYEETFTKPFDVAAGRSLEPAQEDTTGRILQGTGEFLTPFPGTGYIKGAKLGAKGLSKVLGKEAATALGASTVLEAKPKFTEEGTLGRNLEDFADTILGSRYAEKLTGKASKIASGISQAKKEGRLLQSAKELPIKTAAKIASISSYPQKEAYKIAEKWGIDLPANVGARNTVLNWIHNNFLKSMFASKAYKDVFVKADDQMYKKFKEGIDSLGPENITPSEAASQYKNFLKEEKKAIQEKTEELYNNAVLKYGANETVPLTNTTNAIASLKSIAKSPSLSPESKQVLKVALETGKNWGIIKNSPDFEQIIKSNYENISPANLEQILSKLNISQPNQIISREIGDLDALRKELNKMIYNKDLRGSRGRLIELKDAVIKDIEQSKNNEFLEHWRGATDFNKVNVQERIKSDLAHSMLTGKKPMAAFDAMDTVQGIKDVERITGETEKGKKAFNDLKKAKLRQIFEKAIEGSYEDGTLRKAPFAKIFEKGEKGQEVILELVGPEQYKKLSDLGRIADEFSHSGKDLFNSSGTDIIRADRDRIERVAKESLRLLFSSAKSPLVGAGAGLKYTGTTTGAVVGALGGVAAPYLLSKLMANPVFVRESRIYALQRQANKDLAAKKTLNRLLKISDSEARKSAVQINKMLNQKPRPEEEEME